MTTVYLGSYCSCHYSMKTRDKGITTCNLCGRMWKDVPRPGSMNGFDVVEIFATPEGTPGITVTVPEISPSLSMTPDLSGVCAHCKTPSNHALNHNRSLCYDCSEARR